MLEYVTDRPLKSVVELVDKLWALLARVLQDVIGQVHHAELLLHVRCLHKLRFPGLHHLSGFLEQAQKALNIHAKSFPLIKEVVHQHR